MKRFIAGSLAMLCWGFSLAQDFSSPLDTIWIKHRLNKKYTLSSSSTLQYGCNGLTDDFLNHLYRGGYLDSMEIESAASNLLPVNSGGLYYSTGLSYGIKRKKENSELILEWNRKGSLQTQFTDDAFRLGFQGNTRYKGDTAIISGSNALFMEWSEMGIGFKQYMKNGWTYGVSLSFVAGHRYTEASIARGLLYTEPNGLSIYGNVKADYYGSDTSNTGPWAVSGYGTSLHFYGTKTYSTKDGKKALFAFDIRDLGFIRWDETVHSIVDTAFNWTGVDVTPIFSNPDHIIQFPDENDFIRKGWIRSRTVRLPAVIRLDWSRMIYSTIGVHTRLSYAPNSMMLPYMSAQVSYSYLQKWFIEGGAAYGGFGGLMTPLQIGWSGSFLRMQAGTGSVLSWISPDQFRGNGFYINISARF